MSTLLSMPHLQRFEEFPICRTKTFLAHAAASPFPQKVCAAIQRYCHNVSCSGQWEYLHSEIENETRKMGAYLFGGSDDEIALVSSTSTGLGTVANGIKWQPGDSVTIFDGDFPSNIYPWLNLKKSGVEIKFIARNSTGEIDLDLVKKFTGSNTRLVSLSSVNFITGYRIDLDTIGKYLQEQGILFCVDAVQSLGAFPFQGKYVDFAAGSAHKWLLGPMGIGLLYVKKNRLSLLEPALVGWKTVIENKKYLNYDLCFPGCAKRYEIGSPNAIGTVGLHAALKLLIDAGIDNISARILQIRERLVRDIQATGYEVISPGDARKGSGIISFTHNERNITDIWKFLDINNFVVSLRDTLDGRKCIRVAPHFYNTDEEITAFLHQLSKA